MNSNTTDFYNAFQPPSSGNAGNAANGIDDIFHFEIQAHNLERVQIGVKGCRSFEAVFKSYCKDNNLIYKHFIFAIVIKRTFIKLTPSWPPHFYYLSGIIQKDVINEIVVIQSVHSSDDMETAADIYGDGDDIDDDKYDAEIDSIYKDDHIEINYTCFTPKNLRVFINFIKSQRIELKPSQIKQIINEYRAKVPNDTPKRVKLAMELTSFDQDELYILNKNINELVVGGSFNWDLHELYQNGSGQNGSGQDVFEDINGLINDMVNVDFDDDIFDQQTAATEMVKLLEIAETIQKTAKSFVRSLKIANGLQKNKESVWTEDETEMVKNATSSQAAILCLYSNGYERSTNAISKKYQRIHQNK